MMVVVAAHRSRPAGTGGLCVRHTDVGTGQLAARHPASPGPGLHRRSRHQVQEEEGSGSKFRHCTCTTSFHPTTAINGYATGLAGLRHPPSKHCHTWLCQGLSVVRQPSSNHCHNWLHHTPHWFLLHPSSKHCHNWLCHKSHWFLLHPSSKHCHNWLPHMFPKTVRRQFFIWCSNSSMCVTLTDNSNYIGLFCYNRPLCFHHNK